MLTTLEANFVQEYKLNGGNAKQAVLKAGYQASPKNASCIGSRLIRNPKISQALSQVEARQLDALSQPFVKQPPVQVMLLPTKEEYALKAWQRSSDESTLKPDLKHKYYETAGKTLGHLMRDESVRDGDTFQIICKEMNLSVSSNPNIIAELEARREALKVLAASTTSVVSVVDASSENKNDAL